MHHHSYLCISLDARGGEGEAGAMGAEGGAGANAYRKIIIFDVLCIHKPCTSIQTFTTTKVLLEQRGSKEVREQKSPRKSLLQEMTRK